MKEPLRISVEIAEKISSKVYDNGGDCVFSRDPAFVNAHSTPAYHWVDCIVATQVDCYDGWGNPVECPLVLKPTKAVDR